MPMDEFFRYSNFFTSYALFYLWLAFLLAAPLALLVANRHLAHQRRRGILLYVLATGIWLAFFYTVLSPILRLWPFGASAAAMLLCVSPWVLSAGLSVALGGRPRRTDGSTGGPG